MLRRRDLAPAAESSIPLNLAQPRPRPRPLLPRPPPPRPPQPLLEAYVFMKAMHDNLIILSLLVQGTAPASSHLLAINSSGSQIGVLLSYGTLSVQTAATYHATVSGSGFTLTSSKGPCGISGTQFTCGSGVTASMFGSVSIRISQVMG
jgi:hypothetical protein